MMSKEDFEKVICPIGEPYKKDFHMLEKEFHILRKRINNGLISRVGGIESQVAGVKIELEHIKSAMESSGSRKWEAIRLLIGMGLSYVLFVMTQATVG